MRYCRTCESVQNKISILFTVPLKVRGWPLRSDHKMKDQSALAHRRFRRRPQSVFCSPGDGASYAAIFVARLHRVGAAAAADCSDLGAQSMHAACRLDGLDGLRLNAESASEAANAKPGQDYQLLVRGHQPRALVTPVQALLVPSVHVTAPRVAHM